MLMPFQMIPAALIAMRFRANVPFAMAVCWITNPITTPPVLYGQFRLGQWLRESLLVPMPHFLTKVQFDVPGVGPLNAASFILGMIVSGVAVSLCAFPLVHLFSAIMPHHLPVRRRRSAPLPKQVNAASPLGSERNPDDEKPLNDVLPRGD
jgi:uncharacterized protein (DUF2062 family)